jgi:hypothetical protein
MMIEAVGDSFGARASLAAQMLADDDGRRKVRRQLAQD